MNLITDVVLQADLRSFIPQMIKSVTGKEKPGYGNEASRPEWWPKNLTWSNPTQEPRANEVNKSSLFLVVINEYNKIITCVLTNGA